MVKIEKPEKILFITAPEWKWEAVRTAGELADARGQVNLGQFIPTVMPIVPAESRKFAADFLKKWVLKDIPSLGPGWQERYDQRIDEAEILSNAVDFFSQVFDCEVSVTTSENANSKFTEKASQASPLRPAIFVS